MFEQLTVSEGCGALLKEGRSSHVLYGDRLANHLPMALIALERIGASLERMEQFSQNYRKKLVPLDKSKAATPSNPLKGLGKEENFESHLLFFEQAIAQNGTDVVLRQFLPHLLPGLCASAFHALIRLAYAIEANDSQEIAFALAYWSSTHQTLGPLSASTDQTLLEIVESMAPIAEDRVFAPGIIVDRMAEIVGLEPYQNSMSQPNQINLAAIAQVAIQAYFLTKNFTLLHGVTGCHALRTILPWVDDEELALRYFWQALVVAYLSTGSVVLEEPPKAKQPLQDWNALFAQAYLSDDDHVIKIVYTCWAEHQHYESPMYWDAAHRAVEG